jgi:mannitol/fructose-specific phosphotransferase system IIA component (Ntr-type)
MRDIHEAIRERESEIKRINGELEALRLAARLLEEDEAELKKKSPSSAVAREKLSPTGTGSATQFP